MVKAVCVHCGGAGIMSSSDFSGTKCFMCNGTGFDEEDINEKEAAIRKN